MKHLLLVELEGEAYERGRRYGARVADAVHDNADAYLRLIASVAGIDPGAALEAAMAFLPQIEAHAPELLLEMQGIAEGAGCELSRILLINARSELMTPAEECTSLAAAPDATRGRKVILGQNWDWYTAIESDPILLRIRQPRAPEIVTLVEAGQVGKIGMNSAGLGVCLNFLGHRQRGQGLPLHVLLRRMLGCATLGEAVHTAFSSPRATSANVMLAHKAGEILDLELTPEDADFVYGDEGWLVHANHFESPRLRAGDTGISTSVSTVARAARARRLLGAARGDITIETFQTILQDHAYGDHSICRHADARDPIIQLSATRASVIMDLSKGTAYVAGGQPCKTAYQTCTFGAQQ